MRQYYDVYSLLQDKSVQEFIGTQEYLQHKFERFPKIDLETPISENLAFVLNEGGLEDKFAARYRKTAALYYNGQPPFNKLLATINEWKEKL